MLRLQNLGQHCGWMKAAMYKNYLAFFNPQALLSLAEWPEGAQGNLGMYWHQRFQMAIPEELIQLLFPFLPSLEASVARMGARANISVRAVPVVLRTLAIVVAQDALELAELMPQNPVHAMLLEDSSFQYAFCKSMCALGIETDLLPCSLKFAARLEQS